MAFSYVSVRIKGSKKFWLWKKARSDVKNNLIDIADNNGGMPTSATISKIVKDFEITQTLLCNDFEKMVTISGKTIAELREMIPNTSHKGDIYAYIASWKTIEKEYNNKLDIHWGICTQFLLLYWSSARIAIARKKKKGSVAGIRDIGVMPHIDLILKYHEIVKASFACPITQETII